MSRRMTLTGMIVLGFLLGVVACGLMALDQIEKYGLADLEHSMDGTASMLAMQMHDALPAHALLQTLQAQTGSRIRIFNADAILVADSFEEPVVAKGNEWAQRAEMQTALHGKYGGYTRWADDTHSHLALYIAMPSLDQGHLLGVVYISHSTEAIVARLERIRQPLHLILIVLALAVALMAVSWWRNLERIRASSLRMVQGNLDERLAVPRGEMGDIARHFNELAASLEDKVHQLEDEREKTLRFIQDITHELKTPLTGLSGSVHALMDGALEDPAQSRTFVGNVQRDTVRLSTLVKRLLEVERLQYETLAPIKFDLPSLLESVAETFEGEAATRQVTLEVEGESVSVEADPGKIQTVVENLVENALRFAPDGSRIVIRSKRQGEQVRVEVEDGGPGVAAEDRERIFERFYRGTQKETTTGLGLAIAREIVQRHGGTLGVEDAAGQGARFYFVLTHS